MNNITVEQKRELEAKALELINQGLTSQEIEAKLGHEFIFYTEALTGKYVRVTFWK